MLTEEEMNQLIIDLQAKREPSIKGPEAEEFWKSLERDWEWMQEHGGGTFDIPSN